MKKRYSFALAAAVAVGIMAGMANNSAKAMTLFSNGFETDVSGWNVFGGAFDAIRVASGSNGIASASGGFHAEASATVAGNWGGYGFNPGCASSACAAAAFQGYKTSIDIYLDVNGGWADNTRFDFSSAVNQTSGSHLRDFIFNAGFFGATDLTGPGAGTDRFVISASNNSQPGSAFAKNPANAPIAIDATGWYTFMHEFRDDGGVLAVDMTIMDASLTTVGSWTRSDPTDTIPATVGGNRYGWFDFNEFSVLAFDNTSLETTASVPAPGPLGLMAAIGVVAGFAARARRA